MKPRAVEPVQELKTAAELAAKAQTSAPPVRRRRAGAARASIVAIAAAFAVLTMLVKMNSSLPMDLEVTRWLQGTGAPVFKGAMVAMSWPGNSAQACAIVLLVAIGLYFFGLHWECVMSLVAGAGTLAVNLLVKLLIHRPRPTADLVDVFAEVGGHSFPSGHVMFYVGYFGFLAFLTFTLSKDSYRSKLVTGVLALFVILIGPSRIYLGAHWVSDVLAAYLLGTLVLLCLAHAYGWGKARFFVHQPVANPSK